jgi:Tol biopolymer transport system component
MRSPLRARTAQAAAFGVAIALVPAGAAMAADKQTTTRISVGYDGSEANGGSNAPSISNDGRWFAYSSNATNLVPGDTNGLLDIFLYDRTTGTTELVTRGVGGAPADRGSYATRISANGRYVTFHSEATNLVPGDTDGDDNAFVWDRESKEITRLPGKHSLWPDISADGRYVTYSTEARLVPEDTDDFIDVYLYDRNTGQASLVTRKVSGGAAGGYDSTISDDGRYVAFGSDSEQLISDKVNGGYNIFLYDRQTGTTTVVSRPPDGQWPWDGRADNPEISGDGKFVAFGSKMPNLTPGDTNDDHDVFLWQRDTREITLVSGTADGRTVKGFSTDGRVSADGSYVTFWSTAGDLSGTDVGGWEQSYLYDRQTRRNRVVAAPTQGADGGGEGAEVSADGKVVGFMSFGTDLVPGDTNNQRDVFVTVLP